eukprot:Amastigsp_a676632_813.p1 type:complete len:235 gc:universal Amastigsp_a676632_813:48-752(+)
MSLARSIFAARSVLLTLSRASSTAVSSPTPRSKIAVNELVAAASKNKSSGAAPSPTGSILSLVESQTPKAAMRRDTATASASSVKTARKKAEPVLALIRGLNVTDALTQLRFSPRIVARTLHDVVKAAVANAENNFGMRRERLIVSGAWTGRATPLKRVLYANKGRAGRKSRYRTHLFVEVKHVPFSEGELRFGRNARPHTSEQRELHRVISARLAAPTTTVPVPGVVAALETQ